MTILGAIIGGGKSRRFGTDKAAALVEGVALIDHAYAALRRQVDDVVVCGRAWRNWNSLPDLPAPDLGPLGGLNAALSYGRFHGFSAVLSVPVDTFPLPDDLLEILGSGPACFADQHLIGIWPTALSEKLALHLDDGQRSVRSWIGASQCRRVDGHGLGWTNINVPADLHLKF